MPEYFPRSRIFCGQSYRVKISLANSGDGRTIIEHSDLDPAIHDRHPRNASKNVGAKRPLKPRDIYAICFYHDLTNGFATECYPCALKIEFPAHCTAGNLHKISIDWKAGIRSAIRPGNASNRAINHLHRPTKLACPAWREARAIHPHESRIQGRTQAM